MKTTIQWKRFASFALFLSLAWMLCLQPIDTGRTQDKTGDAASASPRAENSLDLRGDVPNPQRISTIQLRKLPRVELRTPIHMAQQKRLSTPARHWWKCSRLAGCG